MQHHHSLDARGQLCPQPLIQTRRLLKTLQAGERFQVIVDNDIAHLNLMAFFEDQGMNPKCVTGPGEWVISATCQTSGSQSGTTVSPAEDSSAEDSSAPARKNTQTPTPHSDYIVVLKSECMGQGNDDLGSLLIKGYLSTLKEIDHKPSTIILYNGGVRLAVEGSGADSALQALEAMSVDIMVCGACVDFFELQGQLAAGRISNMYDIAEKIAATGHVVYP
ncbi:sulfurtransferase-like selenium metabolism protein YedF [Endozoicomonas euniceicola]|uniref:Sulfurtransferase-like selenium metabolism protein YedF n=1 Tax=Endozoicomonas euniceicola TaxID=1234143 RepID=A0ABY6H0H1_9GAMM|nr:sulfurtransferase-like selenium metabolism protein YedF [Endozoicomonas euniceicola]UYM17728.1 sulfurtransferase-like selenium metabolism protein YedF [Endozoicomonas euniceicola]